MALIGLLESMRSSFNHWLGNEKSVSRVNSIDEFLQFVSQNNPRKVDAIACTQIIGTQYFVEHSGKIPCMLYYVSLNCSFEYTMMELKEPVARELVRVPMQNYRKDEMYFEKTLDRAKELLLLVNNECPGVFTRLYNSEGNFIDNYVAGFC